MRISMRVLASIGVVLALSVCLLGIASIGWADGEKEAGESVLKLADALEKGDPAGIKKAADAAKGFELLPLMTGFKKRDATPPGLGFGPKPGAYTPDGIEAQIMGLAKKALTEPALKKQAEDIARAARITEAIGEATLDKSPVKKKMGDKDPADWKKWMGEMKDAAKELNGAAKKGDPKGVKDAANKLNQTCNECHGVFRDS